MAVHIVSSPKTNPRDTNAPLKYYPRTVQNGRIDLDELSQMLSERSTLTQADCYGVVVGLTEVISEALADGRLVELGSLGTFKLSVQGNGVEDVNYMSPNLITKTNIIFKPGKRLVKTLKQLTFILKK